MHIDTRVIEDADLKSQFKFDFWGHGGHLEATMASDATEMAVRGIMYIDTRVIEVADFKSEIKFEFLSHWGHFEATLTSEATKMALMGNMHIYFKVMEVLQHHMPISHSPCRRRSQGPLIALLLPLKS